MGKFIEEHKDIWGDNPLCLMKRYDYHLELTKELDDFVSDDFDLDREILYKIVLWKLNRFPYISDDLLKMVNATASITPGNHEQARETIEQLLQTPGIALPMASTILRFVNPKAFQIIDDRAYRVLLPGEPKYPTKPQKITESYISKSVEIYFKYLSKIHEVSCETLPFSEADRILYQLDIELGNKLGDKI